MANPFDQFDSSPVTTPPPVPAMAPTAAPTGGPAAAAPPPAAGAAANPFDAPAPATQRLSDDEFASALYDKFNAGEKAQDIIRWVRQERNAPNWKPGEGFYENWKIGQAAHKAGRKGQYGRVDYSGDPGFKPIDEAGAMIRQAGNTVLFNFGDEIESALRAVPELVTGGDYQKAYRDRWEQLQERNDLDWELHPESSTAGTVIGAVGGARVTPSVLGLKKVQDVGRVAEGASRGARIAGNARGLAARTALGGAEGAAYGALAATGDGTPDDRFGNTGAGATIGGVIGTVASPAVAAIERLSRPIVERMSRNSVAALARRLNYSNEQIAAAEAELSRQRGLGIRDSTLLDVIDEPGRSVVGSAGAHDAARAGLQDVAAARQTQLPERVGAAANEIVAPPTGPELGLTDDVRSGIDAQRNAEISAALDAEIAPGLRFRDTPLDITPEIADVLGTTMGQRAIREVINETTDPRLREQLASLQGATRTRARSVDPRLPESAQQTAQSSLMQDMPFSIDISERLGRKLNEMGRSTGNNALFSFGRTVREGANSSPRFREIMDRYRQMSGYADAPGVGSGVRTVMDDAGNVTREADEGAGFLAEPASRFETRVGELGTAPMVDAAGAPVVTPSGGTVSERDLARLGAAEQTATRAGRGPSEARGVAAQLYDSPEQRARSVALLGEAGADRLAARMREEVERVFRASRQATKEAPAAERGMAAVESGVNALYTPGPISALRETARFLHRIGMTERDALWIVRNATDPTQTQAILTRLKKAGLDELKARAYTDQLRDAAVRYSVSNEEN